MTFEVSVLQGQIKSHGILKVIGMSINRSHFAPHSYIASEFPMTLNTSDTKVLKIKNGQIYPVARLLRKVCACHA